MIADYGIRVDAYLTRTMRELIWAEQIARARGIHARPEELAKIVGITPERARKDLGTLATLGYVYWGYRIEAQGPIHG